MENDDAIAAGEEFARLDDGLAQDGHAEEPELFELELDGEVHALPAALKGAFLRQADYTRKTQELAEHRRGVEAERQALEQRRLTQQGASRDQLQLMALEDQIEAFQSIDWERLASEDPGRAQELWSAAQRTAQTRDELASAVAHRTEREELQAAREAAEAMAQTGAKLREEIEGWSPEVAGKLVEYAQAFGVTMEELAQAADPRLWKLLHKAWVADQASQRDAQVEAVQAVRPAVLVAGGGGVSGGVRDELSTKEWMRRRGEQLARGR